MDQTSPAANSIAAEGSIPMEDGTPAVHGQSDALQSDEQLMLAFAAGRNDAFTIIFERYKQPLFGFFRRRIADPAQAEELTQETFIAILRSATRYQPSALFRTFLYAIAFRILRAYRRKAAFRATFLGEQPVGIEAVSDSDPMIEMIMRDAVGRLDRIDREVLMLREFEKLSYTEIAEVLALPLNTVRSRLFRARSALHDLLAAPAPSRPSSAPAAEVRA
jgi:RNA polymerase sigma-70 factor (ECF subfamily)